MTTTPQQTTEPASTPTETTDPQVLVARLVEDLYECLLPETSDYDWLDAVTAKVSPVLVSLGWTHANPDPPFPTTIVLFCDGCGVETEGDFLIRESDSAPVRFGYARTQAVAEGWRCDATGDLCPTCAVKAPTQPLTREALAETMCRAQSDAHTPGCSWCTEEGLALADAALSSFYASGKVEQAGAWDRALETAAGVGVEAARALPNPYR